jgi:acyl carrier protein phosphodiesterase
LNYLAHLFLSDHQPEIMVGNFIADFVRKSQITNFPAGIQKGIALHHKIDTFTDTHAIVQESKLLLRPQFGKYAAVIVDVFYDHFLSRQWQVFSTQDRQEFCNEVYNNLNNNGLWLPESVKSHLPDMVQHNWLWYYHEFEGVRRALQSLSYRSAHRKDLPEAIENLKQNYTQFEEHFLAFFPELLAMTKQDF